jgi:hypothetical protein
MRVGIFGSKEWNSYSDIIRNLTVFIQECHELGHDNIIFIHSGNEGAENMITEYVGKTEKFLREKKFKIKESIMKKDISVVKDMHVIESGLEFALVFSTGCKRTVSCQKLLKEYEIPYRLIENT